MGKYFFLKGILIVKFLSYNTKSDILINKDNNNINNNKMKTILKFRSLPFTILK